MHALLFKLFAAISTACATVAHASESQILCRETAARMVDPGSLDSRTLSERFQYRFADQNLFITPENGSEYLYNAAAMPEPGRIVSGHKVILIRETRSGGSKATFIHAYKDEVRISLADCLRRPLR